MALGPSTMISTKRDQSFGMEMHGQWGKKIYIILSDHFTAHSKQKSESENFIKAALSLDC